MQRVFPGHLKLIFIDNGTLEAAEQRPGRHKSGREEGKEDGSNLHLVALCSRRD